MEENYESLGDWERTHYSIELSAKDDGKQAIVMGWARELRKIGKLIFIKLADREGYTQITASAKSVSPELMKKIEALSKESVIAVRGAVKKSKEAPGGIEIIPIEIKILNKAETPLPMEVRSKAFAELSTRLDARFMDLRKPEVASIFNIADTLKISFLNYFDMHGFINVNTPVIVAAATEGGTELFPVSYFDREAFLNQSPQLYKQMLMASGFDKVSIVTPVFRAEPHETTRHINEAIQMDIEIAFTRDEEDALKWYDGYLQFAIEQVKKNCEKQLEILKIKLEIPEKPIKRLAYDETLEVLKKKGLKLKWGEDLTPEAERKICEEYNPVIITKWPSAVRAFYCMKDPANPKVCRGYDLLYNGIELSSGAQREHRYNELIKNMEAKKLNPANFKFYLDAFRFGMPPHSGWSIGLERFTMALLKLSNIREASLFPRTKERLTP